jgi:hypothetical protein
MVSQAMQVQVHRGAMGETPALDNHPMDFAHLPARDLITAANKGPILSVLCEEQVTSHWIDHSAFVPTGGPRNSDGTYYAPPVFGNFNPGFPK